MPDIFLRNHLFSPTQDSDPSVWSVSVEVATGAQLDDVLTAALTTSGLRGTYQVEAVEGALTLTSPARISFDLDLDDAQCDDVAEMTRIELVTFLQHGTAQIHNTALHTPSAQPYWVQQ